MARKRSSSSEQDINELVLGLVKDISEHAEATIKVQLELQYFRETVQPVVDLYNGTDGRESLATRLKMLEDGQARTEDKLKKADNTKVNQEMINIKRDISDLKDDTKDLNDFKEASKASWRTYVLSVVKWIGAIASAYIVFKLTGK